MLQNEIWTISEELARTTDQGDLVSIYLESVNDIIDLHESRVVAGVYARVPETILIRLLVGSCPDPRDGRLQRAPDASGGVLSAIVLAFTLAAVLTLVVDIDRPRDGFLQVSQQPILDVIDQMEAIGP